MEQLKEDLNKHSKDELINMLVEYKLKHKKINKIKVTYNKMYFKTEPGKQALSRANKKYYEANKERILARNKANREKKKREKLLKERLLVQKIEEEVNKMTN